MRLYASRGARLRIVFLLLFVLTGGLSLFGQEGETAASPPAQPDANQTAEPETFPDVVAEVNDNSISRGDLLSRVEAVRSRMRMPEGDLPLSIYRTILNEMIGVELLYQASVTQELAVNPEEVNNEIDELKARFPDQDAFEAQLASENLTVERLREQIRRDLSVQKFVDQQVMPQIQVAESRKQEFYQENQQQMTRPGQLRLRHILVKVESEASEEERSAAREKIEDLRRQIVSGGADFAELARAESDDPGSKESGGEMTVRKGQTVPPFEEAAFTLEEGEVSSVVETRFGFHIIQSVERTPEQLVPYEEVEERIEEYLRQEAVRNELRSQVEEMKLEASVEVFI